MKICFSGKTALVTGATRGIGKQIADDLSQLGATVICTGTQQAEIDDLNTNAPKLQHYIAVNFLDRQSTQTFTSFLRQQERIDICINNAGITNVATIDQASEQDWDRVMSINLKAPFLVTHTVSQLMKAQGSGRIVNISSIWGHISNFGRPIMSSSKFGLRGLTVATANDLAPYGVLVNDVAPGWTLTDLCRDVMTEANITDISQKIPIGRLADPKEISRVVLFLVSELNTYITGQSVVVDGGYTNI